MAATRIHTQVVTAYPDYLRDESRRQGCADGIAFPEHEAEVCALLADCTLRSVPVTVQGSRTGLTGGAVPEGGVILTLTHMGRILGTRTGSGGERLLSVQPGLRLEELRSVLAGVPDSTAGPETAKGAGGGMYFFPPDPTEATASLGGMAACNASGALSFRYGPTRCHVHAVRLALADGDLLVLERGAHRCDGDTMEMRTQGGRTISCLRPALDMPAVKHAAGYYSRPGMDLVDLFIGSEGTLGVITELELRLSRVPGCIWGVVVFLDEESMAVSLAGSLRAGSLRPAAMEYFSPEVLNLLHRHKKAHPGLEAIPALPPLPRAALYLEYHDPDDGAGYRTMGALMDVLAGHGGDPDLVWAALEPRELACLKAFRHAAPECVNLRLDELRLSEPGLTKLATDLAVPDQAFGALLDRYRRDLGSSGVECALFGHLGDNHLHVNMLPRNLAAYQAGAAMVVEWARLAVALGGTVSAEHGIGKLKRPMLEIQFGGSGVAEMERLKRVFDPDLLLNRGTLIPTS